MSNIDESEPSVSMTGRTFLRSAPKRRDSNIRCRACIQFTLPRSVLISPLCEMYRYGCERDQLGKVFVEKREWTIARHDENASSARSG